jgi:hypothetical protein
MPNKLDVPNNLDDPSRREIMQAVGAADILLYHAASGTVAAWLMSGATIASTVTIGTLPPATWSVVTANAD